MSGQRNFKSGQTVIYPSHGVGKITGFEQQEVMGESLDFIVISYDRGMVLKIPKGRINDVGLRHVSEEHIVDKAFETLRDAPRPQKTVWARRVKELQDKVNSGDLIVLCRLLRDLAPRSRSERGLSYSEREFYETAIGRASQEIAAARRKTSDAIRAEMELALSQQKPPLPMEV